MTTTDATQEKTPWYHQGNVKITERDPNAEYVSLTQYVRKRLDLDLKKDPLAISLSFRILQNKIKAGYMEIYVQDNTVFIDWNKYKDYLFKRNFQMPKQQPKKAHGRTKTHR